MSSTASSKRIRTSASKRTRTSVDVPDMRVNDLLDAILEIEATKCRSRSRVDVKAVARRIRKNYNFAISSEVAALAKRSDKIARARNARLIMSNEIPVEMLPQHVPYFMWYPDVPSEETCKQLVQKYPDMKYQVGRTCAVAGYVGLYCELDLLPDVSIAGRPARLAPEAWRYLRT